MKRDPRDTSADRRRRTIEAPNGARVIFPVGTSDIKLLDHLLMWTYVEPLAWAARRIFPLFTPLRDG